LLKNPNYGKEREREKLKGKSYGGKEDERRETLAT
jgi:hypothetical protein